MIPVRGYATHPDEPSAGQCPQEPLLPNAFLDTFQISKPARPGLSKDGVEGGVVRDGLGERLGGRRFRLEWRRTKGTDRMRRRDDCGREGRRRL